MTNSAEVSTPSSRVSTETPSHIVSSLLHLVTQWMSRVMVSVGSLRNSSHVHRFSVSISPVIEKVQRSIGVRGVGPADRTGKSRTRYWPGGRRSVGTWSLGRPRNEREVELIALQAERTARGPSTAAFRAPGAPE